MKKYYAISILFLMLSCGSTRQTSYNPDDLQKEDIIYDLKGTQSELYVKAHDWMVKNFVDLESVISFTDKDSGTILGKYLIQGTITHSAYNTIDTRIYAYIDIKTKDNSAKINVKPTKQVNVYKDSQLEDINFRIQSVVNSFRIFMEKESDNNW